MSSSLQQPSSSFADNPCSETSKKRRASKACSCCRTRKIRCDVLQTGLPCTKCRIDGFECAVEDRKKRRKRSETSDQESPVERRLRIDVSMSATSSSRHSILHRVPHYPFFRSFAPRGQEPLLPAHDHDESASSNARSPELADDDAQFLRHKGVFDLPPKKAMDELVSNYFQLFHPFFPIVDKIMFLDSYHRSDCHAILSRRGPSLLLLQAILFTATATIPMSTVRDMGFSLRKQARGAFHRRTRYLYDFDYETDDIIIIQALLLMSHYYSSMVEQKHTWFWVHQAISIAQGIGLHRDAKQSPQRKLWARVWWACFVRDRLITLGTGRPMHINSLDCSVPVLTLSDVEEDGDSDEDRGVKAMFVEFVRLCQSMGDVLSLPRTIVTASTALLNHVEFCETALRGWRDNLIEEAKERKVPANRSEKRSIRVMYRAILHMMYNIVMISLHQSQHARDDGRSGSTQSPPPKVRAAAQDSTRLVTELVDLDLVKFCPIICEAHWRPGPLAAFLNDRMHGIPHFIKALEPLNQVPSRRRTPVGDRVVSDHAAVEGGGLYGENNDCVVSTSTDMPTLSAPINDALDHVSILDDGNPADLTLVDVSTQLFDDWLVDFGYFRSIFPSA
ncbi:Cutinase transcription factor 1 beta-like protein [Cladobotryum mycophilum]|uniref:Cutinase transcription factor 1 beta-like protein n=1 Tax=Cladobotryum mycophilum TaxID=491253 RepID=A0ABR0S8U1_9HYPO